METTLLWNLVLAGVGGLVVGLVAGLLATRRSHSAARVRELLAELESSRQELGQYRDEVSEHFTRTSDLLRRMTLQYRAVYEHLAEGARNLCPDGVAALEGKADEPPLPLEASTGYAPQPEEASGPTPESVSLSPDELLEEEMPRAERA